MRTQRQVVDYALRRRALLREVYSGRVGTYEVCDASPYLRSAARFHGEPTDVRCPVCRREHLTNVHYIYGEELKTSAGQARRLSELPRVAATYHEVRVYVVEVCRGCGWNYLVEQFVLDREGPTGSAKADRRVAHAPGGGPKA
jgi:rubredoxin